MKKKAVPRHSVYTGLYENLDTEQNSNLTKQIKAEVIITAYNYYYYYISNFYYY